jgi:CCR4-NOT transcription complex subunit 1
MKTLEPTTILRDRATMIDQGAPFPEFNQGMDSLAMGTYEASSAGGTAGAGGQMDGQPGHILQLGSGSPLRAEALSAYAEGIIADIANKIVINPQLMSFTVNPGFKRAVQLGIEGAVREVST